MSAAGVALCRRSLFVVFRVFGDIIRNVLSGLELCCRMGCHSPRRVCSGCSFSISQVPPVALSFRLLASRSIAPAASELRTGDTPVAHGTVRGHMLHGSGTSGRILAASFGHPGAEGEEVLGEARRRASGDTLGDQGG